MTPTTSIMETPAGPKSRPTLAGPPGASTGLFVRVGITLGLLVAYFVYRETLGLDLSSLWLSITGVSIASKSAAAWLVATVLVGVVVLWFDILRRDKRFHAPLLITSILLFGDAGFGILENHSSRLLSELTGGAIQSFSPTFVAIFTTIAAEMLIGRFFYGKWPHLASAYVSGISAGILVKSPATWPFVMVGLISITSKYVLRVGDRHLWNPTNLGVAAMLTLAPEHVASLSVQAGNEIWAVAIIWILGGLILWQLGRLHIPLAFVAAFVPLSLLRAWWTSHEFETELAPMTSPMFQLYIFFMITDPKTTTKTWWRQVIVAVLVAVTETYLRLRWETVHSLYYALFTVGPITNLIEIVYSRYGSRPAPNAASR